MDLPPGQTPKVTQDTTRHTGTPESLVALVGPAGQVRHPRATVTERDVVRLVGGTQDALGRSAISPPPTKHSVPSLLDHDGDVSRPVGLHRKGTRSDRRSEVEESWNTPTRSLRSFVAHTRDSWLGPRLAHGPYLDDHRNSATRTDGRSRYNAPVWFTVTNL